MADVESNTTTSTKTGGGRRGRKQQQPNAAAGSSSSGNVQNPYSNNANQNLLPRYHPLNILRRVLYMGISIYGLQYYDTYHTIQHSSHIRHEWFKIGLASTIGTLSL